MNMWTCMNQRTANQPEERRLNVAPSMTACAAPLRNLRCHALSTYIYSFSTGKIFRLALHTGFIHYPGN